MKPTSTQITIVLGLVAVGTVYLVGRRALDAAGKTAASVGAAVEYGVQQITPWNHDNVFAASVNKVGGAVVSNTAGAAGPGMNADGSWTLGGAIFDVQQLWGPAAVVSAPAAIGSAIGAVVKKAASAVTGALPSAMPGERKTTAADWASPTQYDALGNVIF